MVFSWKMCYYLVILNDKFLLFRWVVGVFFYFFIDKDNVVVLMFILVLIVIVKRGWVCVKFIL